MDAIEFAKPVIGLCAYSGSGKTTLLEGLLPILCARNLDVAVIKHAHHSFDVDHPDKDSFKIRKAGARQVLISSQKRWALMREIAPDEAELSLQEALERIDASRVDFVIVEGFKSAPVHKIEIHRPALGKPLIATTDHHVIAIATDQPENVKASLPLLALNDPAQIADFIGQFIANRTNKAEI
ncbi:MAG: molybdopterin-guanine dinucleotide biosynthesis protein B [Proteobacteria bacterium]|nr:molybdopterin-guanine dinucleotide biosynthesis protein B [Pseudomonadota bacterium]